MHWIFNTHRVYRRLGRGVISGLLVGLFLAWMLNSGYFVTWRTSFKDALYQGTGGDETSDFISIVAIDDASLQALGRSPSLWSRKAHADLIDILGAGRVKAIAFDILFAEPTPEDARLVEALAAAGQGIPGEKLPSVIIQPLAGLQQLPRSSNQVITFNQFIKPDEALLLASQDRFGRQYLGHVNILPDSDGFVRAMPLAIQDVSGVVYPTLGMAAYLGYLGFSPDEVRYDPTEVSFSGRTLSTNENGQMLIYYFGSPANSGKDTEHHFPVYSYIDILCSHRPDADYFLSEFSCAERSDPHTVSLEAFQGKLVFIGILGAVAEPDSFPVPISQSNEAMFGVEIHATLAENVHQSLDTIGRKLPLTEQTLSQQISWVLVLGVVSGLVFSLVRWYMAVVLALLAYLGVFGVGIQQFQNQSQVIELFFPLLTLSTMLFLTFVSNYLFEERRRSQINDLFQRYVSPEIARKIVEIADKGELDLSGEEREITVMFADIRGFTALSEGLSPKEVVEILNVLLERINLVVLSHGGAINKYIGDNIMAFWNAPYPQSDHAWRATEAGLAILKSVEELNASGRFKHNIQFGVGINTGVAVVGNIGSSQRLEYTPIGDTVNIAARLSGVAQGGSVLVGEQTHRAIRNRLEPYGHDEMFLKGKMYSLMVYEYRLPNDPSHSVG